MMLRALFVIALTLVASASGASDDLIISDAWVRADTARQNDDRGLCIHRKHQQRRHHYYRCICRGCRPHLTP